MEGAAAVVVEGGAVVVCAATDVASSNIVAETMVRAAEDIFWGLSDKRASCDSGEFQSRRRRHSVLI